MGITIDPPEVYFSRSSRTKVYTFQFSISTVDRDQTDSHRSKLRSCTAFISEQLNPWNRLQLQDAIMLRSSKCYHSTLRFKTVRERLRSYGSSQTITLRLLIIINYFLYKSSVLCGVKLIFLDE